MVDLTKEKEFGAEPTIRPTKQIADIDAIINSNLTLVELEMENDTVIMVKYLGALDYEKVMKKYPLDTDCLTAPEKRKLISAYRNKGDDELQWLTQLSEEDKGIIAKVTASDKYAEERTAYILSLIAIEPTITEDKALSILRLFRNPSKLRKFTKTIETLSGAQDDDLKNY
jgi:hypothetical protein